MQSIHRDLQRINKKALIASKLARRSMGINAWNTNIPTLSDKARVDTLPSLQIQRSIWDPISGPWHNNGTRPGAFSQYSTTAARSGNGLGTTLFHEGFHMVAYNLNYKSWASLVIGNLLMLMIEPFGGYKIVIWSCITTATWTVAYVFLMHDPI